MSFFNHQARSHESPMDFEWNGSHGPTDPNSPFPKLKPGQKGSIFGNPQPQAAQSSFIASSPTKPAPQFRNPSFTTPRKPFDADLFSEASGIDSSPGDNADAEDTPEPTKDGKAMTIFSEKQPIFGRYGAGFTGNSPGRMDLKKGRFSQSVIANKARKRKRKDRDYSLAPVSFETDEEDDAEYEREKARGKVTKAKPSQSHWLGSFLSGVESRPSLPSVLSTYLQLAMNFFILGIVIYLVTMFIMTIRHDVDKAAEKSRQEVIAEINKCVQEYAAGQCERATRLRAMEQQCEEWQACMDQDPTLVGRARVSADTFANILNAFIEPISWKSLVFIVVIIASSLIASNVAFVSFRKHVPPPPPPNPFFQHPPPQTYNWGLPPQTPQHHIDYDGYGQGYQQIMPSGVPGQRSPSKGQRSPSKGDRY